MFGPKNRHIGIITGYGPKFYGSFGPQDLHAPTTRICNAACSRPTQLWHDSRTSPRGLLLGILENSVRSFSKHVTLVQINAESAPLYKLSGRWRTPEDRGSTVCLRHLILRPYQECGTITLAILQAPIIPWMLPSRELTEHKRLAFWLLARKSYGLFPALHVDVQPPDSYGVIRGVRFLRRTVLVGLPDPSEGCFKSKKGGLLI